MFGHFQFLQADEGSFNSFVKRCLVKTFHSLVVLLLFAPLSKFRCSACLLPLSELKADEHRPPNTTESCSDGVARTALKRSTQPSS